MTDSDVHDLAALDIGTNSFHLVVARRGAGDRFETLTGSARWFGSGMAVAT